MNRIETYLVGAALLATIGCSGGSGTVAGTATGDFVVMDAPITDLVSFKATVNELRLHQTDGGVSANLLAAPARVEFLGLQTVGSWLSSVTLPAGTFAGIHVIFDGTTLAARAKDGTIVPTTAVGTTLDVDFTSPITVDSSESYHRILVDLNLANSLTGNLTALTFTPTGRALVSDGADSQEIDDFRGLVRSFDSVAGSVTVDAFSDDDLSASLGQVKINLISGAALVGEDDLVYANFAAFFADLQLDLTLIEVHGDLTTDGSVDADKVEVEDHNGGANVAGQVKVEGLIESVGAGSFDLLLMEIEKGESIAQPVLDGLGDPGTITISHDGTTVFFREDGSAATSADLTVASKIKVYFDTFTASPFPAAKVRLNGAPRAEVVITDISGLPSSIVVNVDADEPWVTSGDIASDTTNVTVDLTGATVWADSGSEPTLAASNLLVGMELKVRGDLAGLTVTSTDVRIRTGELTGLVTATPSASSLTVSLVEFDDPFGAPVDQAGPYTVQLDPTVVVDGDANSVTGLMALFSGLQAGQTLEIELEGIGTGVANEILAFEVEVQVQ
jgi:Domain of unknown function (DUF4382)